jgi:YidC/Oxa1 family membrane protein insertase
MFWVIAFVFTSFWLWIEWEQAQLKATLPQVSAIENSPLSMPTLAADVPRVAEASQAAEMPRMVQQPLNTEQTIEIKTDVLDVKIDLNGGNLVYANLLNYRVKAGQPDTVVLMKNQRPNLFVAQSGLASNQIPVSHKVPFQSQASRYVLAEGQDELRIPLTYLTEGLQVTKTYLFKRDTYVVELTYDVQNQADTPWNGAVYSQLAHSKPSDDMGLIYTYTGGVVSTQEEKYLKYDFDDSQELNLEKDSKGGWLAMIQHYFLGAALPSQEENNHFFSRYKDGIYTLGYVGPTYTIAPGETQQLSTQYFIGPKDQERMEAALPGLELTVDYGIFHIFAAPIFWVLKHLYDWVGNWGWAIILITILIKILFYPLSDKSYRSMAHMRKVAPKLQALKEAYGHDRQAFSQKMMQMYKEEKINPLGGCLPILVQIPVFIALYWVLVESVEMRQADFALWLTDLSSPDPYFVLPLLMGITMFIQQKLNPPPMDPMQEKIMKLLPWIFTVFFVFFPAGLVLYWVVNNILSIAQQWYITQNIAKLDADEEKARKLSNNG